MSIARIPVANYATKLDQPIAGQARRVKRGRFWRPKHRLKKRREAVKLRRLEEVLAIGNWLYESVKLIERNWRAEVLEMKTPFDPDDARSIADSYCQWAQPRQRCLEEIRVFEGKKNEVRGAREFRKYCAEVSRILAGDYPFFDDASKAGRWAALTATVRQSPGSIRIDEDGKIFEMTGERFNMPGLEPADILEALEDVKHGRLISNASNADR